MRATRKRAKSAKGKFCSPADSCDDGQKVVAVMNETTIDVYGHVIPNTGLFVTVWYLYLVIVILDTIAGVYLLSAMVVCMVWIAMQKKCGEWSIGAFYILMGWCSVLPFAFFRYMVLARKSPVWMVAYLIWLLVDILMALIRAHYAPDWEEIKAMRKFARWDMIGDLVSIALEIGGIRVWRSLSSRSC